MHLICSSRQAREGDLTEFMLQGTELSPQGYEAESQGLETRVLTPVPKIHYIGLI